MNIHSDLKAAYETVSNDRADRLTLHLVRRTLDNMSEYVQGDQGAMWETARQTLENVLDVAAGNGTNETAFEVRHCLEHDSGTYAIELVAHQDEQLMRQLLGDLFMHDFAGTESWDSLDIVITDWCELLGSAAEQAVIEYAAELEEGEEED